MDIVKHNLNIANNAGFSLVEVLLAVAIFVLIISTYVMAMIYGQENTALAGKRARAVLLASEGLAVMQNMGDSNFANLINGTYGLALSSNTWSLTGVSDVWDIFTREIIISSVNTNTKKVESRVSWQQNLQRQGTVSLITYLTNWAVIKGTAWATAVIESFLDLNGNQAGLKVQVQGDYAYVVRQGGDPEFAVINISNPASPSLVGSLVLAGTPSNLAVSGNYAYVSSSDNSSELQIIDITTPNAPNQVGSYNATGSANANGVSVVGTVVYLSRASSNSDEFYTINVTNPASPSLLGSLNLGANANEILVNGNYAYVTTASNSQEIMIINVTDPSNITNIGSYDLASNSDALTIARAGNYLLVGCVGAGIESNFHILDTANPINLTLLGSYTAGGDINDIALNLNNNDTYAFLATSESALEFQVLDITDPANIVLLTSAEMTGQINGVAYSPTLDRAVAVGTSNDQEFIIIYPQ